MMVRFWAALSFLTVLPVPSRNVNEDDLSRCMSFFPVVGLIIGLFCAVGAYLFGLFLPGAVSAMLVVLLLVKITGALHLDGLADSADALCSARNKEKMLEIMHDSRIGTMGAVALIMVLGLKSVCLYEMADQMWAAILLAPLCGRSSIILQSFFLKPAREDGLGRMICGDNLRLTVIVALILGLFVGVVLLGLQGVFSVLFSLAMGLLFAFFVRNKIGGYTGDTLGAGCEITEVWCLIALTAG